jgi:DNA-binding MarR family transcriptional regulator
LTGGSVVVVGEQQHETEGSGGTPGPEARDEQPTGQGRRGAAEAVERELVMMFRRARNVSVAVAAQVHPGLDPASYSLLLMVDDAGSLRGMDVADRTGLDKSTVSRQIATLVQLDLLERVPDPDDGRARRIQLSELGRERLAEVRRQRRKHLHSEFASWSTADLRELARLLGRLNAMF